ncbi:MAG: ERCC4 domain-containing protein [Candidatus Micrarchaeales archaeon]
MGARTARIIIDSRERNSELINGIRAGGVEVEFRTAHVGDYIISDRVCIERKTISDFESSIMNGRLFDQIKRLKENYDFPMLVLEGDADYFRLKSSIINGTIAALYVDYGIGVLCTTDAQNTAEVIAAIARHEQDGSDREPSLKGGARSYTHEQFQEHVVGNLPGIGPKLGRALLKHFKSIKRIANASTDELMEVEKIGNKKAELIHNTLNRTYEE